MVLLYLIATYSSQMAKWSHTVLGKVIAVFIILLYGFMNIISGLLASALVIFYYQTDYVQSMESFAASSLKEVSEVTVKTDILVIGSKDETSDIIETKYERLEDAYPLTPTVPIVNDSSINEFRQKHCSRGHLVHKGQIVKPEMSEHIYPEINQDPYHKCNICDESCSFDLNMIDVEAELMHPKSSNDWFEKVWSNMRSFSDKR